MTRLKQLPPDRTGPERQYLDRLAEAMSSKMEANWRPEAQRISNLLIAEGMLHETPPLRDKNQFLEDVIAQNPVMLENSNLPALIRAQYRPKAAMTAFEIASLLVPAESA